MSVLAETKERRYVSDNAQLMAEWDFEKNNALGLTPQRLSCGNGTKVWWKCIQGHSWQAIISHRSKGSGCPYCAGRLVSQTYNLQVINPALSKEWNYEKNDGLTPSDVLPNSNKKAWWRCSKGHEWQSVIANRNKGIGCPICKKERNTSFPEYAIFFYLYNYGLNPIHSYKEHGYELDIYIPNKKIAIEYDGYFWHKNKVTKDIEKNSLCARDGIKLYRIREGLTSLNDSSIDFVINKNQCDLPWVIAKIISEIVQTNVDIDLKRDSLVIENLREYSEKSNALLYSNPEIAKEWNYDKNGNLRPDVFLPNSQKTVWWKCSQGHEWQAKILNRNSGYGCPYCSGRYAIKGETDLQTVNPNLAKEWNYEKNNNLTPSDVLPSSDKKVWWKCELGHEWQTQIKVRTKGNGCPYCSRKRAIAGENDLQTINPALAQEWNCEKNDGLLPKNVLPNCGKKVWWKCAQGHEWKARIDHRNTGSGCPYCAGLYVIKGENDLQTVNPTLAQEWNYEKNNDLTPSDVLPNSDKKVWWKCELGHEWQTQVKARTKGTGCPYCSGRKVVKGFNDLQTVNPMLAKEWNRTKNGVLLPEHFTANSKIKAWWVCAKGHEWQATIANRNHGNSCPICLNRVILAGYNDLKTLNPTLAQEWQYEKNKGLTPEKIASNSGKKVWWICRNGHEWQARVAERNKGYGCPYCSGHYVVKGENDLQTTNPTLAVEWDYEKNFGLTPSEVLPNSNKKAWWKCEQGHVWQAIIYNRNKGQGCPDCARIKRQKIEECN